MNRISSLLLTLAVVLPVAGYAQAAPAGKPTQLPADSMAIGKKYVGWFLNNNIDSLVAHLDSAIRVSPEGKTELQSALLQFASRVGVEESVVEDKYITRNGGRQFWHIAKYSGFTAEPVVLRLAITAKGEIAGYGMNPLSRAPAIDP